ncbi:hypothetical protein [Halobellus captivus]|uniref:hypothetical protein n=1 Tax=Halobellus captivus TaxID=2592614 RepID=UPI001EF05E59|nr:hypothetical protein [Halobellus captivus]
MNEAGDRPDAVDGGSGEPSDANEPSEKAEVGDTFGVGIHVTESEFQFVVHVPSDIDSGWTDPQAFQGYVERAVWDRLDRESTLRRLAREASVGETVTLGHVTLHPDGTVVDASLDVPGSAQPEGGESTGEQPEDGKRPDGS